jgi:hypothetical protein
MRPAEIDAPQADVLDLEGEGKGVLERDKDAERFVLDDR